MTTTADWQPIETAPKDGRQVLLCQATGVNGVIGGEAWGIFVQVAAWWDGDDDWIVYCSLPAEPHLHFDPTHWAELPANPMTATPPPVAATPAASPRVEPKG